MSIVNQKGGFFRTLEINRDSAEKSTTTLIEPIVKQAENYVIHIQRFITNIMPAINQLPNPIFTVLHHSELEADGSPDTFTDLADAKANGPPTKEFSITNQRTVTDIVRALVEFSKTVDGLDVYINADYSLRIMLSQSFGLTSYVKVDPVYAKLLGLPEYLSYFRDFVLDADTPTVLAYGADIYDAELDVFANPRKFEAGDPANHVYETDRSLILCDTRQYLDITFTAPHFSQISVINGAEERRKLLARFPLRDHVTTQHVSYNAWNTFAVRETLTLGLTDLCKNNPNVHTALMLPGEIQHANVRIETTYLEGGKWVTVPTDFGTQGFWSLKLLLTKKIK